MSDLTNLSDEQLKEIAGISDVPSNELMRIAGLQSKPTHPENIFGRVSKVLRKADEFSKQFQYGFTDVASLGTLSGVQRLTGNDYDPGEGIGRTVGEIGGFIGGAPEMVGRGALKLLPKMGRFASGATKTGVATASLSPSELAKGSTHKEEALKIGGMTALGGVTEAVPNILMKTIFRKNIHRGKLDSLIGELGKIKESIKTNPNATIETSSLVTNLENIYGGLAEPVKKNAKELKTWIDYLKLKGTVHGDEILQMERELGASAKFGGTKGGFLQFVRPKSPVANEAIKAGRREASETYDVLATKQGYPEFAPKSKKASSILKRYPDLDPSKGTRDIGERVGAAIFTLAKTGSPGASFMAYLADKGLQTPSVMQKAYKILTGKSGKALSSGAKKLTTAVPATQL